jgi:transcriptional regulator with PAS, ATPase and Fis domain
MPIPVQIIKNGKDLNEKIDFLHTAAIELLHSVSSFGSLAIAGRETEIDFEETVQNVEIHLIKRALEQTNGDHRRAARLLNLKYAAFFTKLRRYEILLKAPDSLKETKRAKPPNGKMR